MVYHKHDPLGETKKYSGTTASVVEELKGGPGGYHKEKGDDE